MNRLGQSVSPYLLSHAENPVDWWPWGPEAFEEARRRDVPVLVSIGYATCHWCHVMARESFSDDAIASVVNERFVAVKVDREEHPEVDSSYMAAAGAFTQGLGWPLNVFATPNGRPFFASTYSPPQPMAGHPSFRQVIDAVWDAWTERRDAVEDTAGRLAGALASAVVTPEVDEPAQLDLERVIDELASYEDEVHGGFGGAPKFPVAPVLLMLQQLGASPLVAPAKREQAAALARRTLAAIAESALRDPVEGGFFRYGTRRDWSEPHYERMLYDNALLLRAYAAEGDEEIADGIVRFLVGVLRREGGAFGSAQDSESLVDGERSEGGYYALDEEARRSQPPPAVDEKVLTGWNGLAIGALAVAGDRFGRKDWIRAAEAAADFLIDNHIGSETLVRASLAGRPSAAPAALEDYGMAARGLLDLALASARPDYAKVALDLVERVGSGGGLALPGGGDPVLAGQGIGVPLDPSEGAYPSGSSQTASAALTLYGLTGEQRYRRLAEGAMAPLASLAVERPISMGGALAVLADLAAPTRELVVVTDDPRGALAQTARTASPGTVVAVVGPEQCESFSAAGFALFDDRVPARGGEAAYLCEDLVCALPGTTAEALAELLRSGG